LPFFIATQTQGKEQMMTEDGMLSIVPRGTTYQVRYALSNPYGMDHPPYTCPDEGTLVALLHHCGIDIWSIHQAGTELRKGRMAVLPIVYSQAQMQAYFPPHRPRTRGLDAAHQVGKAPLLGTDEDPSCRESEPSTAPRSSPQRPTHSSTPLYTAQSPAGEGQGGGTQDVLLSLFD